MKILIRSEYSAQRRFHQINPTLPKALHFLLDGDETKTYSKVADVGCGKLRHYDLLSKVSSHLYLIDTEFQLSRLISENGSTYTIKEFIDKEKNRGKRVTLVNSEEFSRKKLRLNLAVSVAVADVVPKETHLSISNSIFKNLRKDGKLLVIVPRNDKSILERCFTLNRYKDGYVFRHHGVTTFFRNFKSTKPLVAECKSVGFKLWMDHSRYNQVCLIFSK
jgi:hypothetical protein